MSDRTLLLSLHQGTKVVTLVAVWSIKVSWLRGAGIRCRSLLRLLAPYETKVSLSRFRFRSRLIGSRYQRGNLPMPKPLPDIVFMNARGCVNSLRKELCGGLEPPYCHVRSLNKLLFYVRKCLEKILMLAWRGSPPKVAHSCYVAAEDLIPAYYSCLTLRGIRRETNHE